MKQALPRLSLCALLLVTALCGCETAPKPDNRIKLMPSADGKRVTALPPDCLSWHDYETGPFENHPWPQYGCAQARNLAAQVERPQDVVEGKELGKADGIISSAAQSRYLAGKQTPLIDPYADKPAPIIKLDDTRPGGGQPK